MPGARVSINDRFVMESEALDFRGIVASTRSCRVTTGVKSGFLGIVERLFPSRRHYRRADYHRGHSRRTKVGLDIGKAIKGG